MLPAPYRANYSTSYLCSQSWICLLSLLNEAAPPVQVAGAAGKTQDACMPLCICFKFCIHSACLSTSAIACCSCTRNCSFCLYKLNNKLIYIFQQSWSLASYPNCNTSSMYGSWYVQRAHFHEKKQLWLNVSYYKSILANCILVECAVICSIEHWKQLKLIWLGTINTESLEQPYMQLFIQGGQ